MKWPDHYKLPDKILSWVAIIAISASWIGGAIVAVWIYLTGGN